MNWLPTKERFEQCTATNVFKCFDNSAPPYMSEIFSPVCQGRITRRSKNKLNLPFRKTNTGQNGLSHIGPKIWNSLQSGLKSSNNVNSFKHKIKDKFFNDLQNRENSLCRFHFFLHFGCCVVLTFCAQLFVRDTRCFFRVFCSANPPLDLLLFVLL